MKLKDSQKNKLFKAIERSNLDPSQFKYEDETANVPTDSLTMGGQNMELVDTIKISYVGSDFSFEFYIQYEKYYIIACPGKEFLEETIDNLPFNGLFTLFAKWLERVEYEASEPDLWEQFSHYNPEFPDRNINNYQFTIPEANEIEVAVDKFEKYIKSEFDFDKDDLSKIKENLNYLKDSSQRLGRKDWYHVAISTIMMIAGKLNLDPSKFIELYDYFTSMISGIKFLVFAPPG